VKRGLRLLFKDSLIYGLAGAANRLVKILLVPVVAKAFPAAVFGAFDTVSLYVYMLAVAGILGVNSAVIILATRGGAQASAGAMRVPASTGLRITAIVSLALTMLVIAAPGPWSSVLLGDSRYATPILWAAASVPFSALLLYALSLLQWSFRRAWYVAVALGSALVTIALSYVVAFHTDYGLTGLFAANLIGQAGGAIVALYAARDMLGGGWDRALARQMLAVGLPFAIIAIASNLVPSVDRLFLVQAHSLADAGIYGMGQKIAALSTLVLTGFQAAWGPFAFAQRDAPGKPELFGRVFLLTCTAAAWLAVVLVCAAPEIARLVATAAYSRAAIFVGPLALSAGLGAVFLVVAIGSVLEGRSLNNLTAYLFGLGVTVAINFALLRSDAPPLGIAWANCAGQAAAVVLMAVLSQRVHPVPYPFVRGAAVLLGGGALAITVGSGLAEASLLQLAAVIAAVSLGFVAWTWVAVLDQPLRARVLARLGAG
jgi:O-antigen/teichoic acid export membrane protein